MNPSTGASVCELCERDFVPTYPGRKTRFCGQACRNASYASRKLYGGSAELTSGTQGAVAELLVCANLLRLGYEVFRAVSPHCSCDVLALKNGRTLRVEVRTGYKTLGGELRWPQPKRDAGRSDHYAVVFGDTVTYVPELS